MPTVARRNTDPGATLQMLVLAAGPGGCVGVDLGSGALVRATYPRRALVPLVPFDTAAAPIVGDDDVPDPVHPEQVDLAALPRLTGHLGRKRAERWLRPLLHPTDEPVLGLSGPAIQFWELAGQRPSVAVLHPDDPPVVVARRGRVRCRFPWRGGWLDLPMVGHGAAGDRRVVVALTPPVGGYCYKVVAGLVA